MKTETIIVKTKETAVKIQNSHINAVRIKDIERKAVRVYENDVIGISGAIGEIDLDALKRQAKNNLKTKIPYPYALTADRKDHRNYNQKPMKDTTVVAHAETLLETLRKEFSDFIFSESIVLSDRHHTMTNTDGLDLSYIDQFLSVGLLVKEKTSVNLFDNFLAYHGRHFEYERFLNFVRTLLQANRHKVSMPSGDKVPVFMFQNQALNGFLLRNLNGEVYANGSSLFEQKIGTALFDQKINVVQNYDSETAYRPFFDTEGTVLKKDRIALIQNGVFKRVFTDKKTAHKHNLEHTGAAGGGYDDMPTIGATNIDFTVDSNDVKKTLNGKPAILVMVNSGGDFNADGQFASPVQAAYLYDGENISGFLPEFNMRNRIYDMLGSDYIGTFEVPQLYFADRVKLQGYYMHIHR